MCREAERTRTAKKGGWRIATGNMMASTLVAFLVVFIASCDDSNTITGPDETIIIWTFRDSSFDAALNFIFTQNNNSGDVSLNVQNASQRNIASFNYSINYSISGQGWAFARNGVGPISVGTTIDEGIIARNSPTLTENGFDILVTSLIYGEVDQSM